jgi:6-pyruvoyltetrahydropterin/6-carboxytetrahydropterin synthase
MTTMPFHEFSAGHRVVGHANKCAHLHGHNFRVHFHVRGDLDIICREMDFSAITSRLCDWLDRTWDHKMLIWKADPLCKALQVLAPADIVVVPFNPTAENMARFLVEEVGPAMLVGTGCRLVKAVVEATCECRAEFALEART